MSSLETPKTNPGVKAWRFSTKGSVCRFPDQVRGGNTPYIIYARSLIVHQSNKW